MKILIATGLYPPDIGGPATYTKMLESHLPKHDIEFTIVPYGWVRHYPKLIRHTVYAWKLIKASKDCDIIYALDPISVGLPARFASLITGKPLWLRIAGDYAWEQGQQRFGVTDLLDEFVQRKKKYPIAVRILQWLERYVADRAKHIIVPSDYMKGIVAAWGVSRSKITRVYSALHPVDVPYSRDELRKQFAYKGLVVTTAGRLTPWKGTAALIDAIALLKKQKKQVTLVVIGDGVSRGMLEERAQRAGLQDDVRFIGQQAKDAMGAAIKPSDVFVLNTAYEGLPHTILEVMDLGVPVVTTPVGGNVELIKDGVNGLFVPYNDVEALASAILRAGTHVQLRENLTQHAHLTVKQFSQDIVVEELVSILKSSFKDSV